MLRGTQRFHPTSTRHAGFSPGTIREKWAINIAIACNTIQTPMAPANLAQHHRHVDNYPPSARCYTVRWHSTEVQSITTLPRLVAPSPDVVAAVETAVSALNLRGKVCACHKRRFLCNTIPPTMQAPLLLRLVFHDAGTFRAASRDGGLNASIQYACNKTAGNLCNIHLAAGLSWIVQRTRGSSVHGM